MVWPWVMLTVMGLCLSMMAVYSLMPEAGRAEWLRFWGFVPARITALAPGPPANWFSPDMAALAGSLFVHSGWLHLLGNLAYLWVFGIPVERAVGHWRFLGVFLLVGGCANLCVAWQMPTMDVPVIGASGGVSAVIGVYLGLFPARRIGLWLPLGVYLQFARVPALLVIGSWFALQLLYTVFGPISGAVAWWTHVAGFVAGVVVALLMRLLGLRIDPALRDD